MSSISIHQPQYLPWHNYFKKMKKADIFIILDTVDFQKNGLQNRNQIKPLQNKVPMNSACGHDL